MHFKKNLNVTWIMMQNCRILRLLLMHKLPVFSNKSSCKVHMKTEKNSSMLFAVGLFFLYVINVLRMCRVRLDTTSVNLSILKYWNCFAFPVKEQTFLPAKVCMIISRNSLVPSCELYATPALPGCITQPESRVYQRYCLNKHICPAINSSRFAVPLCKLLLVFASTRRYRFKNYVWCHSSVSAIGDR